MAPIHPLLRKDCVFDAETTRAMATAFDGVCIALGLPDGDGRERAVIATRIIELARRGERNADHLRDRVLREAGAFDAKSSDEVRKQG